jgi:hypothetical protein
MNRKLLWIVTFLSLAICAWAQAITKADGLSPQAQDIAKMAQAGVDESVLLTYIKANKGPFALTSNDIETLKALGVSSNVVAEMLRRDTELKAPAVSPARAVTEDQLFRMRGGLVEYGGRLYPIQSDLDPSIRSALQADPLANRDILAFEHGETASRATFWGGFALVFGGPLYGAIASNNGVLNDTANSDIVIGAISCGLISWLISSFTNHAAYFSLYNGLGQYNRDLIAQSNGR